MPEILEDRPSANDLADKTWSSIRAGLRQMPVLYSVLFGTNLLLTATSFYVEHQTDNGLKALALVGIFLASFLVLAIAAVPMHRFILLGEVSRHMRLALTLQFFCWLVVIMTIAGLPFVGALLIAEFMPQLYIILNLVAFCAGMFLFIRFAMVFPAVAIGDFRPTWREQIGASWDQMRGQVWLFIAGVICVAWPFILLGFLVLMAVALVPALTDMPLPDLENMLAFKLVNDGFISFAIFILHFGLESWLYAWIRQPTPALEPPADT